MSDDGDRRRRARWSGLVGFSATRLWKQATRTTTGRIAATISVVALTIAFLLIVTGIALGLAQSGAVTENDADVRIAPEQRAALSTVDGVESPRLGEANTRAAQIRERDGVEHATPVLVETVRLETADGVESRPVVLVGVVPDDESRTVAGLPTGALTAGDPHYAEGSYDGPPSAEIVLSRSAAARLNASTGDDLAVAGGRGAAPSLTVTAVEDTAGTEADAAAPVALVHLSELQTFSGASDGELADKVLVWGDPAAAESAAAEAYPQAAVEARGDADPASLFDDRLAFATSLIALVVGVTVCAAFVATTMGITVNEDRRMLAVLEALGVPVGGRLTVVAVSILTTTLCGALIGVALGSAGVLAVDAAADMTVAEGTVAALHPLFVPYGVGVALLSGLVAAPYPILLATRVSVVEEVGG